MIIGVATVTIYIHHANSLKEKRGVLQSLIKRIRNKFNVAVAEIDEQDKWQVAVVGLSVIGGNTAHASSQLANIIAFIEQQVSIDVGYVETELL